MTIAEWVLCGLAVFTIIYLIYIIVSGSIKSKKSDKKENDKNFICHEDVVITKKIISSYVEGLSLPKTVTQYSCVFLLKDGEEKSFLVPDFIFNQLNEEDKGNLYIKDNMFFDFEEIK